MRLDSQKEHKEVIDMHLFGINSANQHNESKEDLLVETVILASLTWADIACQN